MKCSIFIGTSLDGYIATEEGDVDWLQDSVDASIDMGDDADMGFNQYLSSVDCIIMGRKSMEKVSSFNLTDEQWPYRDIPIFVLSRTVKEAPENLKGKVELFSGDISVLVARLDDEGFQHAYVDGGTAICSFLNKQFINEITTTTVPLILGGGIALFNQLEKPVAVSDPKLKVYPNGCVKQTYRIKY